MTNEGWKAKEDPQPNNMPYVKYRRLRELQSKRKEIVTVDLIYFDFSLCINKNQVKVLQLNGWLYSMDINLSVAMFGQRGEQILVI